MKMWRLAAIAALVVFVQSAGADAIIPENPVNLATTSGPKITSSENMHQGGGSLFDGNRNRWLGYAPKPAQNYYSSDIVTFVDACPLVNAYRVYCGWANSADRASGRQATMWELYGSNDGGLTWTLLHAQTEKVIFANGSTKVLDYVDCTFENTVAYSSYKFRVTGTDGNGYVAIDDVALHYFERTDTMTVLGDGFTVGEPTPAYGATSGLAEGETVRLNVADTRAVDPATSRRYELTGFKITSFDGEILHEGVPSELPYDYVHGTRGVKVLWTWVDTTAEYAAPLRTDVTVPENASLNEITDGQLNGEPIDYGRLSRAQYGPNRIFDYELAAVNGSRWLPSGPPYYAGYTFKENGVEVRRNVTGIGLYAAGLNDFDFEGSNDGSEWKTLLSVSTYPAIGSSTIVSNTWDFVNPESFSRYRLVVRKATLTMWNLEFYNHRGADVLEIFGSPAYGKPSPDYGVVANLAEGQELTLKAPQDEIDVSADEKSVCTGYKLEVEGYEPVFGSDKEIAYAHAGKGTALTWMFSSTFRHQVAVKGAGSVDCDDVFFKPIGETVTITATAESEDAPFLQWQGDVPEGQSQNPTLTFTVDGPRSLVAVFAAPVHVSATGDDANDGSSWSKAVRTVARGWEISGGVGKLYLGEGEFSVTPELLSVVGQLLIEGRGPEKTVLVPDGEGTILRVNNALAVVSSLRVKGASSPSGFGAGLVLNAGTVTNCCFEGCSSGLSGGGVWMEGTGVLVDSVITNCTAVGSYGGALVNSGTFRRNLVVDCTGTGAGFSSDMTVEGCVFRGNSGTSSGAVRCENYAVVFTNCVFASNRASTSGGVIDGCPTGVQFVDCQFVDNYAGHSCGIGMHFGGSIRRSLIVGNSCGGAGGYGVAWLDSNARLENCLVTKTVGGAGAFYFYGGGVYNCTIVSNRCNAGGVVSCAYGNVLYVYNTIIAANVTGGSTVSNWTGSAANATYSCIEAHDPAVLGEGSISDNPRFTDAANGDYTLRRNSPCVNRGANAYVTGGDVDLAGKPRIHSFGGRAKYEVVDMGCYESPWRQIPGLALTVR